MSPFNLQTPTQQRDRYCVWGLSLAIGLCWALKPGISWAQFNDPTPAEPPTSPLPERPPVLETPEIPAPTPFPEVGDIPQAIALEGFAFRGNTAFTQAELQEVLADLVGESVTFNDLLQAANRITAFYASNGFITTGAYLPSQELEGGTVEIQIVEGRLDTIDVTILEGRLKPGYVRRRIARGAGTPFNINRLQEVLQLLQVDPLIGTIRAELLAGVRPGENVLEVGVSSADSFAVKAFLNNERNPVVGTFERGVELTEGNLLGFGDRLTLFYSNTDGSNRVELGYAAPVNATNGRLSFDARFTENDLVEPPFDELDIDINVREFEVGFRQPVLQRASATSAQELSLGVSFARRASDSSVFDVDFPVLPGADAEGDIRLSVLQFTQEWLQRNQRAVFAARSQFSLGLNAFDATEGATEDTPDGEFFAWRGQAQYLQRLGSVERPPNTTPTLLLRTDIQLADSGLLSLEQFSLGGPTTVRGFRRDTILTDNGFLASAEVRIPVFRATKVDGVLEVIPFFDVGTAWNVAAENPDPNTLVGLGVGVQWQMADRLNARVNVGIPLVDDNLEEERTWQENGVTFRVEYTPF